MSITIKYCHRFFSTIKYFFYCWHIKCNKYINLIFFLKNKTLNFVSFLIIPLLIFEIIFFWRWKVSSFWLIYWFFFCIYDLVEKVIKIKQYVRRQRRKLFFVFKSYVICTTSSIGMSAIKEGEKKIIKKDSL